ncbi:DUF5085 family protein [Parageobacillus toebii]|uniref:Uncharacterized protein n=1 Tax=Parageobacillus toebii TaxID=153151 RepID=A0A150MLG7_9BACL|nr:DUF5085 family protein [Parageobacillus toebii]KYD25169.1 hypothetical protein B4110_1583 [Parageobacillus toebii]
MIVENHRIAYRNVASKIYQFYPEEIHLAITDFDEILRKHGYRSNGNTFFSILSDPADEIMAVEIFLSVEESHFQIPEEENIFFRSYFSVYPMIMTRIVQHVEELSQVKYWELIEYMKNHNLKQRTPVFIDFKAAKSGKTYVEMSVGVKYSIITSDNESK